MSVTPSRVFFLYGLFLILTSFFSFAASGFESKAKSALIMGGACATSMFLVGMFSRTRNNPTGALPVQIGKVLVGMFTLVFGWRGWKIRDVPEKRYLLFIFATLSFISAMVVLVLVTLKTPQQPKQSQRKAAKEQQ